MPNFEQCDWCGSDKYPNQLTHSEIHGGKVCADCRADHGPKKKETNNNKKDGK